MGHRVHGERHTKLVAVHDATSKALAGLDPHMTREERQVFPAISRLEAMELDLHEHIHKESDILFPRVEDMLD
jgi:iron-sulfur cluster repair protein YtfE (RIC family)